MNGVMSKTVQVEEVFGEFCAIGNLATSFLKSEIYPLIDAGGQVVFDFEGVRNMNSSFSNAMFANLVRRYGTTVANQLVIRNTRSNVKTEIRSSFSLARSELKESALA